jgi:hypothetical protein
VLPFTGGARFLFKGVIMATAFDELISAIIEMEVPSPIPKPRAAPAPQTIKQLRRDLVSTLIGVLDLCCQPHTPGSS